MGLAEVTTILVQGLRARDSEGCHRLRASSFLARGRVGQGQVYEDNDGSYRTEGRGGEVVVEAAQGQCKMATGLVGAMGKIRSGLACDPSIHHDNKNLPGNPSSFFNSRKH
ncbi:hypothetical protein OPV22_009518 [Ensete ventricosum]|uniref:Uncharacterized protein n=1 Tax=Ensete ventricosum TaxID=4639 RepID=A0AAV8RF77_ENSVE|nr:hypothetical protein OPV22_009518 [Ensete ventricosum]